MRKCCEKVIPGVIGTLGKSVGIASCTAHDFRRTLISNLIEGGTDMALIQRIVGHESVETTVSYDRREDQQADNVMDTYDVPATFWEESR
jgi:integrase